MVSSGIYFSDSFEDLILEGRSEVFEDRYGGPYTHISRTLAKVAYSGDMNRLHRLFMNPDGGDVTLDQLERFCRFNSKDNGLKACQNILSQLISREKSGEVPPSNSEWVPMNDGSCFDVTRYYIEANSDGKLRTIDIDGNVYLKKSNDAPTMINTNPVLYNGILLPRGSLSRQLDDGQLVFLRLTPFIFDTKEEMISAFGTEITKAERLEEGNIMGVVSRLQAHSMINSLNRNE